MAGNQLEQTRLDGAIPDEAPAAPAAMRLGVSAARRVLPPPAAQDKALPFQPLSPSATTLEATKEAGRGTRPRFATANDLRAGPHAAD